MMFSPVDDPLRITATQDLSRLMFRGAALMPWDGDRLSPGPLQIHTIERLTRLEHGVHSGLVCHRSVSSKIRCPSFASWSPNPESARGSPSIWPRTSPGVMAAAESRTPAAVVWTSQKPALALCIPSRLCSRPSCSSAPNPTAYGEPAAFDTAHRGARNTKSASSFPLPLNCRP
jgi:hypothetical protein